MMGWKGLSFLGYIVGRVLFRALYICQGAIYGRELKTHLSPKMLSQISTWTKKLFRVFKKLMHDALAVCFHQQALVSESIVVGENTNNGRF